MGTAEVRTFCRLCTAGCGVLVSVEADTVMKVRGDKAHPISQGYTCVKGRSLGVAHHDPTRLNEPMIRRNGRLVEVGWTEWLDDLSGRLSSIIAGYGPSAVGGFYSGGSYFDASGHRIGQAFLSALGTNSVYSSYTLDSPNKPLVADLVGGSVRLFPVPDLEGTEFMLIVATNPVISHGHGIGMSNPLGRLRQIRSRGQVWVLDPRRTETARAATRHLSARPGTDYAVLAFLVRELLSSGADQRYLEDHVAGTTKLKRTVAGFDIDTVAGMTGLQEQDLLDLLSAVRRAGRVSIVTGTGASMSRTANVLEWMAWALGAVTGSLDRPRGTWFNPGFFRQNDRSTFQPAPPEGNVTPGPLSRPELCGRNNQLPAVAIPDEVAAGNLRALFALGANLVAANPQTRRLTDALRDIEILAVVDIVANETTEFATHVAPAAGPLERSDLSTSSEIFQSSVVGQYTPATVPLSGGRRPLWWIMAQIADRLGLDVLTGGLDPHRATTDDVLAEMAAGARLPFSQVLDGDGPVFAETSAIFGWVLGGAVLPEGRWRIAPPLLVGQLAELTHAPGPLVLIPRRERRQLNGFLRFLQETPMPEVIMHPADADRASVGDGDVVTIGTDIGEMQGLARIDADMSIGVLSIPHGWRAPSSVNDLLSGEHDIDSLTGMPTLSGVAVTLRRGSTR
ncbi:molybdopterin-dependent oxidoreductase [Pseudonocardia ailaonensis]|uniref:Molybdopterin-dependent oxidoreductase n=1 Tax=Pseudonocardia ailaonensis TaxID=367279 RepID=A0ABN2MZE2_9PSEU